MNAEPFSRIVRVERTGSTNADLRAALHGADEWPHLSVLLADHQDAGRGRSGRSWETPPGTALTASIVLRPAVPTERLSWLTLLAGLAIQQAVADLIGARAGLKWPNDVLLLDAGAELPGWGRDRKVAGVLAEVVSVPGDPPASRADDRTAHPVVVLGIGVNLTQTLEQLPVPWATSLALAPGVELQAVPTVDDVLSAIGRQLAALIDRWENGDLTALRTEITDSCVSLRGPVEVQRPGGGLLSGHAVGLSDDGGLLVRTQTGETASVLAGDVQHVRKVPDQQV